jgi:hypothetical protein
MKKTPSHQTVLSPLPFLAALVKSLLHLDMHQSLCVKVTSRRGEGPGHRGEDAPAPSHAKKSLRPVPVTILNRAGEVNIAPDRAPQSHSALSCPAGELPLHLAMQKMPSLQTALFLPSGKWPSHLAAQKMPLLQTAKGIATLDWRGQCSP